MRIKEIIFIIIVSLILPLPAIGDIYQWVDERGVVYFTNIPPDTKFYRVAKEDRDRKTNSSKISTKFYRSNNTASYQDYSGLIQTISEKHKIDPSLVRAVIKTESNFRNDAVSKKGARGLMQLMPQTANELNIKNSFDPEENIDGGVRYLKYLLDTFDGNLSLSLAAYNAGPELVQRLGRVPSIKETRDYVRRVLSLYNGSGIISFNKEPIYKIISNDGTTIFTNTPYNYYSNNNSLRRM